MFEVERASAAEMAKKWGLSPRRVRVLCAEGKIFSARRGKDGVWTIPVTADRPVDGRGYRYRKVPSHFKDFVRHADAAVERARWTDGGETAEDRWLFFLRGSAHHLHRVEKSSLNFQDVCTVIAGGTSEGKSAADQEEVRRHCRALEHVAASVRSGRRLSVELVLEVARILNGPRVRYARGKDRSDLSYYVYVVGQSRAHPVIKAGNFLTEMFIRRLLTKNNERIGYMIANFILMRAGYPPVILFRRIFEMVRERQRRYREQCWEDRRRVVDWGWTDWGPPRLPPVIRSAFLNACVIRAVIRSCRYGLQKCVSAEERIRLLDVAESETVSPIGGINEAEHIVRKLKRAE